MFTPCQDTLGLRNVYHKVQVDQNWQIPVCETQKATTNKTKWPGVVTKSMMIMLQDSWLWSGLRLKRADNQNWRGNKGGMGHWSAPCMVPQGNCKIGIRNRMASWLDFKFYLLHYCIKKIPSAHVLAFLALSDVSEWLGELDSPACLLGAL